MLRSREEILREIDATVKLTEKFYSWREAQSEYSARTAHPFQRNGAPFRFKLSKAQQVD